jgi:hypothetical protein
MKLLLTNIRWLRVVISSFLIVGLSFMVLTIVTTGYAFILAFEAHGKPEQAAINHFAAAMSQWMMPSLELVFTFIIALMSTKKIGNNISIHGLLIGILAGVLSVALKISYGGHLHYRTYIFFLIIVGLGFFGGFFNQRQRMREMNSPG